ncbi:hypothetical protein BC937DRAFT_90324 [Endogone sp. FLAS-F59071]|nr:hypothetical protein BC937DRAFT_90324 [Endogone sp. FLAS-F59071]|eukprot:RUS17162.1 hypothetical protein BC937DRAFT_90324 [Endogone sp. FLAS-F59071]
MSSSAHSSEEEYYDVEQVLEERTVNGKKEYYIKWEGYVSPDFWRFRRVFCHPHAFDADRPNTSRHQNLPLLHAPSNTWEPEEFLNCPDKLKEFHEQRMNGEGGSKGGAVISDDEDDDDERLFVARSGVNGKGKGKETAKGKGKARETSVEKHERVSLNFIYIRWKRWDLLWTKQLETSPPPTLTPFAKLKRTAPKASSQRQTQKKARVGSSEITQDRPASPKGRDEGKKGSHKTSSPKVTERRKGSLNRRSLSPKVAEPTRKLSLVAAASKGRQRSLSSTSSGSLGKTNAQTASGSTLDKSSKGSYKIPKRDPTAPLPPPLRPASITISSAASGLSAPSPTSPTSPLTPITPITPTASSPTTQPSGSLPPKYKRAPPPPAAPNFDITKVVAGIEKSKQTRSLDSASGARTAAPFSSTSSPSSSLALGETPPRAVDSRANGAAPHRAVTQNTARRTIIRPSEYKKKNPVPAPPPPVVNDRVPPPPQPLPPPPPPILPIDSTPSWHGRLIRKGKYVADVNLLAVFGRSANKLDIFGRLAGKENINIHSILPMHQVANILPPSLAEVDLFELHASANFLDLLKLANMLSLNDIAGIITIQPYSMFLVLPTSPQVCEVLGLRQSPHSKALLVHLPLAPFTPPSWLVPSFQPTYISESDTRRPEMIESELVALKMKLPYEIQTDSRGMQFAIFGPTDHIEVEEMRRMVQSFGGVFDETFSAESLRFVLIHRCVQEHLSFIPNLGRLKRRRGITFVLFGTSVALREEPGELDIVFPSGGLVTTSLQCLVEDPNVLDRLQTFAEKQSRRGQQHSWRIAFRPDILRRLREALMVKDPEVSMRLVDWDVTRIVDDVDSNLYRDVSDNLVLKTTARLFGWVRYDLAVISGNLPTIAITRFVYCTMQYPRAQEAHYAVRTGFQSEAIKSLDLLEVYKESERDLLTMARLAALEHLNRRFFLYIRGKEEVVKDAENVAGVECLTIDELESEFSVVG